MKKRTWIAAAAAIALAAGVLWFVRSRRDDRALAASLDQAVDQYRKIIVLMHGADTLDEAMRARCVAAGRQIFWQKQNTLADISRRLAELKSRGVRQLIRYLTSNGNLHDADKLAFLDLVDELGPGAEELRALRDNLQAIQLAYRQEVTRIFSQFATRGAAGTREKWDAYVVELKKRLSREKILAEFGADPPMEPEAATRGAGTGEIFGNEFPTKAVALTFDDGPHPKYTEQILALLRKYGIRACFFELGTNLGTVDGGTAKLSRTGEVARKVLDAGHAIANHSFSHPVLSKLSEVDRAKEIENTNLLLQQVAGRKPELFRAPYGARNQAILKQVTTDGLKSVMWTIDSLDWADPIPESIAMRVLHDLNQKHKGIILFHDIHKQSVLALSPVIEELQRQEYTFLSYQNGQFGQAAKPETQERTADPPQATAAPEAKRNFYRESWAILIGINDYENWPKLRYPVNDANGMEEQLVNKFGFKRENIRKLVNGEATRQRILEVLGDEFADGKKVRREDRVLFFFAGHGATRTTEDGRQIGFIVPADAGRTNYYSTAISMTALREAADLIAAKHIYFIMDSCYSGLALSRGSGEYSRNRTYLEEVTRRAARQILTAGGADQQVADDGPNGHSVFTWALLQGLDGQADLDGNGVITASELGAYISPIVTSFSKQTPTVGNLVGSEGGEFIFELQPQALTSLSQQLDPQALKLNEQLASIEKQIAAKRVELLRLQQSVQAESAKLAQTTRAGAPAAAKAKPQSARAYDLDRQGQQLYREKKYDQAIEKFKQAVELKPKDPVLLNNLGFLYSKTGRNDEAIAYLKRTLESDPNRKEAHGNLADTYYKMGRNAEAKQEYVRYLELWPASPNAEGVRRILRELE